MSRVEVAVVGATGNGPDDDDNGPGEELVDARTVAGPAKTTAPTTASWVHRHRRRIHTSVIWSVMFLALTCIAMGLMGVPPFAGGVTTLRAQIHEQAERLKDLNDKTQVLQFRLRQQDLALERARNSTKDLAEANARLRQKKLEDVARLREMDVELATVRAQLPRATGSDAAVSKWLWGLSGRPPIRMRPYGVPDCSRNRCSQAGQDDWVLSRFRRGHRGFFLDIGAHDGVKISNTLKLEQNGWTGICIEPIPSGFESRQCRLVRAVVADRSGRKVVFNDCTQFGTDGGDGGLSGFEGKDGRRSRCREEMFVTSTMMEILGNPSGFNPPVIDYVNLDVEGSELQVLQAFPFKDYCSKTWSIEHNNILSRKGAVRKLMAAQGCSVTSGPSPADDFFVCNC